MRNNSGLNTVVYSSFCFRTQTTPQRHLNFHWRTTCLVENISFPRKCIISLQSPLMRIHKDQISRNVLKPWNRSRTACFVNWNTSLTLLLWISILKVNRKVEWKMLPPRPRQHENFNYVCTSLHRVGHAGWIVQPCLCLTPFTSSTIHVCFITSQST